MSQYIGTAMLVSSTATPEAGKIGELMITMPAGNHEVNFVFLFHDDESEEPHVINDNGRAVRNGNMMTFTQRETGVEYAFEMIEWEMF